MKDAATPALSRKTKAFTLLGLFFALFIAALDQTIVATAGPSIKEDLHIASSLYAWISICYIVASTMLVPICGKLLDTFGRRHIIITGIAIFLLGSLGCGLSQATWQLLLCRALQGVGAAGIFTTVFTVVADLFARRERSKYTGIFGAVFGLASLVGPLLGGFITDTIGWHWVFFINLPVGALALTLIALRMPSFALTGDGGAGARQVDFVGAALLALGIAPLLFALSSPQHFKQTALPWMLFVCAAIGLASFVLWELRAKNPLVELRLFRMPTMSWGSASIFFMGGAFLSPMVFLPLFMVHVVGASATAAGLTISPLVLGAVVGNVVSGQLAARLGRFKSIMLLSLVLLACAFAIMALTLTPASTQAEVTAKMVLLGLGLGPTIPLYTVAIQNAVPLSKLGMATAMVTFFRQMGAAVGLAVVGALFGATLSHAQGEGDMAVQAQAQARAHAELELPVIQRDARQAESFTHAIRHVFMAGVIMVALAFVTTCKMPASLHEKPAPPG